MTQPNDDRASIEDLGDNLPWQAAIGNIDAVRRFIAAGAEPADVNSALYWSSRFNRHAMVRIPMNAGADPVAVWESMTHPDRVKAAPVLDDCAETMTPEQREALAPQSDLFVNLKAIVSSSHQHHGLRR